MRAVGEDHSDLDRRRTLEQLDLRDLHKPGGAEMAHTTEGRRTETSASRESCFPGATRVVSPQQPLLAATAQSQGRCKRSLIRKQANILHTPKAALGPRTNAARLRET